MKISSWIIWMDSKSKYICPQKRKAEVGLRQTEEEKNGRGQGHMKKKKKMKAEIGVTQQEARNRISSRASEESDTLPIA